MIEQYKKLGILGGVAGLMFALLLLFLLLDISLGPIQITSIATILSQFDNVKNAEHELTAKQGAYNTTIAALEKAKVGFEAQKAKYEAISDETIEVVKEATMQEEYSIEYMWIRLGNYAKMNNLDIVLIEPGGGQEEDDTTQTNTTNSTSTNTTTSTPAITAANNVANTNNNTSAASSNNSTTSTKENDDGSLFDDNKEDDDDGGLFDSNRGDTFKIQVTGSYMNVSDFVFAVENDNELRFKLDNISMEYESGTTIRTTFDVKNMVILK